jgi:hypothetical protein
LCVISNIYVKMIKENRCDDLRDNWSAKNVVEYLFTLLF